MAAALRNEPGLSVDVTDGDRGEFMVQVDGQEVIRKGDDLPPVDQVVSAVRNATAEHARV